MHWAKVFILMIYSILTIPSGEAVLTYSEPMSWRRRRLLSWRSGSGLTRLAGMSGCRTVGQTYSTVSAWHWYIWAGFLLPHVASVPCSPLHYTLLIGFVVSRQSCFTCANFTVQAFKDSQRCKKPFTLMVAAFPPMSHVRACQSLILQILVAPWRQHRQRFPWFPDLRTPQTFWLPKSNQVLLRGLIYKIVKDQSGLCALRITFNWFNFRHEDSKNHEQPHIKCHIKSVILSGTHKSSSLSFEFPGVTGAVDCTRCHTGTVCKLKFIYIGHVRICRYTNLNSTSFSLSYFYK